MDAEALRAQIRRLAPWHHDVEVAPGVRTGEPLPPGSTPPELGTPSLIRPEVGFAQWIAEIFPGGLAGRSVLDCACNAGGYLFAAAQHGAGRGFGFDARDHWIDQARFLAAHLPAADIEFATCTLDELPELGLEPFDVILFKGLFYHLPDPIGGLRIAANLTRELIIVNTAARYGKGDALVLNPESRTELMSGVHGLAWLPTSPRVLTDILAWCGFPHARLRQVWPMSGRSFRVEVLAAREPATFADYDAQPRRKPPGRLARALGRLFGRPRFR